MKGRIFLFLFALPFFGVGVWMGYSMGSSLNNAWQMRSWTPVEATLSRAGYETHSGDDSDTYEAYASYSYNWNGSVYHGDRVSLSSGADNIGDYQQDTGNRLRSAMNRGEAITIWVDPDNPADAVIDRDVRWGLMGFKSIFFFVFGGVGLGMIVWAIKAPAEKDLSKPEFRESPWLANDHWQSAEIKSGSKAAMWGAWIFAAIWSLVSAPLPFLIYAEVLEKNNLLALVGLLFPVVGLGLLWWAISRTMEWRRFGPAPVNLDPFPGSIGGHVGGTIDIRLPFDPSARFSLTLTSLRSYESGSGKDRSRKEKAEWQDTQIAHATSGSGGTRLMFRFEVPDGLEPSDATQDDDTYHLWRLNLKAELPGTDIDRDYEIPVYATHLKSENLSGFSLESAKSEQRQLDLDVIRDLVRVSQGVEGKAILYPMGRHVYNGLVGMLIGAIFAGAGWFLAVREDHWFMGGIFGFVGSIIAISGFYYLLNSLEVSRSGSRIRTVRRILGIPVRRREMNASEFVRFSRDSSMQTQSGSKHVMYYKLFAERAQGPRIIMGEGFKGASQADAAAEFLCRELGLTPQSAERPEQAPVEFENLLTTD